ncbi:MAG TPA: hypothetical protein GX734_06575 [Clostridiaceae bacterium]|nr:hypothetical protein [Clostridiaceae bacterium]
MKKYVRLVSVVLVVLILATTSALFVREVQAASPMLMAQFNEKLKSFKARKNYSHKEQYQNRIGWKGGSECFGFANELCVWMFGSYPTGSMSAYDKDMDSRWNREYGASAVNAIRPGSVIRTGEHSRFVTNVKGNDIYYCDANTDRKNTIVYGRTITKADLRIELDDELKHYEKGDTNRKTGWVATHPNAPDPEDNSIARYIVANSIIRSAPNGNIITRPWRPLRVAGMKEGAWLKFTYGGKTAYVAMSSTRKGNPQMTGYAKQKLNLRYTPTGKVERLLPMGYKVSGVLVDNMVKFTYDGKTSYVYAKFLQKDPVKVTCYVVANSIIRSTPNGNIITRPWRPLRVTGTIEGAWLKFTYEGETAYVAMSSTRTDNPPMTGYAKQNLNLSYTPTGKVERILPKGYKVSGVLVGDMVKFSYNGKASYVYANFLQKDPVMDPVTCYVVANSIIRSTPNGNIITRPWRPLRVTGTVEGAWLKFLYEGETAYVAMSSTRIDNPPMTGYAKQNLNIRYTPTGKVERILPKGNKVSGVLVGNMVKFTYDGRTSYVYAKFLQKDPVQ